MRKPSKVSRTKCHTYVPEASLTTHSSENFGLLNLRILSSEDRLSTRRLAILELQYILAVFFYPHYRKRLGVSVSNKIQKQTVTTLSETRQLEQITPIQGKNLRVPLTQFPKNTQSCILQQERWVVSDSPR